MTSQERGLRGEALALQRLEQEGMQILEKRWKDRAFEVDLIAFDPATTELVFIEVKTRATEYFGYPATAVTNQKISRIVRAANHYIVTRQLNYPARFDIFSILLPDHGTPHVDYLKNAFYTPLG